MKTMMAKISIFIFFAFVFMLGRDNPLAEEGFPIGCWGMKHFEGGRVSGLWLCFRENGELHGVDVHRGHGADFGGNWKFIASGKLRFKFEEASETCSIYWNKSRPTLTLEACTESSLNGVFEQATRS